jgi:hypothetical protein
MPYKKGQSGNYKGRPKGARNKITKTVREGLKDLVQSELKILPKILEDMTPHERGAFFLKALEFVIKKADDNTSEEKPKEMSEWSKNFVRSQIAITDNNGKIRRATNEECERVFSGKEVN